MSEKVKVGIWGLGRAGGGMHMREIEANKDILEIVAVCDIDAERAESFGKKLNVPYYSDPAKFLADKNDKQAWHNMIQTLPSSYNQMRTVTLNYENLINMYYARRNHKLAEWHALCDWILSLPYANELICVKDEK